MRNTLARLETLRKEAAPTVEGAGGGRNRPWGPTWGCGLLGWEERPKPKRGEEKVRGREGEQRDGRRYGEGKRELGRGETGGGGEKGKRLEGEEGEEREGWREVITGVGFLLGHALPKNTM